jgi:HPt (histidine-containing phosphotransfer) domain-containing protein
MEQANYIKGDVLMDLFEELKTLGVDIDDGMERMMGKTSLYERMLFKFVKMMDDLKISPDFDTKHYTDIVEKAHTIKGASGNLSITPVYDAYTEIVNMLRSGEPEKAKEILKNVLPVQQEILECIQKHMK